MGQQSPEAEAMDEPTRLQAIGHLAFLVAVVFFLVFSSSSSSASPCGSEAAGTASGSDALTLPGVEQEAHKRTATSTRSLV